MNARRCVYASRASALCLSSTVGRFLGWLRRLVTNVVNGGGAHRGAFTLGTALARTCTSMPPSVAMVLRVTSFAPLVGVSLGTSPACLGGPFFSSGEHCLRGPVSGGASGCPWGQPDDGRSSKSGSSYSMYCLWPRLLMRARSVLKRCLSFELHAARAFSAMTGWYKRPSLHLIQPRSAPARMADQSLSILPRCQ